MPEAAPPYDGSTPLTNTKHEKFAVAYAGSSNAADAARAAGYSARTAKEQGCRLLTNANTALRVKVLRDAKLKALHMGADETLAEIAKLARFNIKSVLHTTPDGDPYVDLSKASDDDLAAISEAKIEDFTDGREVDEHGETIKRDVRRVSIKAPHKLGALTTLMKHHGLLRDRLLIGVDENFAAIMEAQQQKARKARERDDEGEA